MNKFISFIKPHLIFSVIFLFLVLGRFIWIDRFPPGMQYDEVEYSLSGKTFQLLGTDLSGTRFPDSLITTQTLGQISPLPYIILSPLWYFLDINMAVFRSIYVVLNSITSVAFGFLLYTLFKNKTIAYLGTIVFLLNPWSFFLSRHGMDGSFALLFYVVGMTFLLKDYSKKNLIISFIFFFLGCFSYHGAKLILVPMVSLISLYKILTTKKADRKIAPYVLIILGLILTIAGFIIGGTFLSESIIEKRSHEFVFTNADNFSGEVNNLRTASIQTRFQNIMINKIILAMRYFIGNYLAAFSPTFLFLRAEVLEFHGFFYVFEIIFLILGFIMLFQKNKNLFLLLTLITLMTPITTATSITGFSILNRAILLLPMLLIFITYGLYNLYLLTQKYIPGKLYIVILGFIYACSFIYFQYKYFFILPIQINGHYQTNSRIMAKYLSIEKKISPHIVVLAPRTQVLFSEIMFYLPREKQEEILKTKQTFEKNETFTIDNITIATDCSAEFNSKFTYIIDPEKVTCFKNIKPTHLIINQKDAASEYFIVNGKTCRGYNLSRFRNPHLISDFKVETMNNEQFCTRWIASPN